MKDLSVLEQMQEIWKMLWLKLEEIDISQAKMNLIE